MDRRLAAVYSGGRCFVPAVAAVASPCLALDWAPQRSSSWQTCLHPCHSSDARSRCFSNSSCRRSALCCALLFLSSVSPLQVLPAAWLASPCALCAPSCCLASSYFANSSGGESLAASLPSATQPLQLFELALLRLLFLGGSSAAGDRAAPGFPAAVACDFPFAAASACLLFDLLLPVVPEAAPSFAVPAMLLPLEADFAWWPFAVLPVELLPVLTALDLMLLSLLMSLLLLPVSRFDFGAAGIGKASWVLLLFLLGWCRCSSWFLLEKW